MYPVTLQQWGDWYTNQWDRYCDQANFSQFSETGDAFFRQFSLEAYTRLRALNEYIDAIAIDFNSYNFSPRELIAAAMYLVLGS